MLESFISIFSSLSLCSLSWWKWRTRKREIKFSERKKLGNLRECCHQRPPRTADTRTHNRRNEMLKRLNYTPAPPRTPNTIASICCYNCERRKEARIKAINCLQLEIAEMTMAMPVIRYGFRLEFPHFAHWHWLVTSLQRPTMNSIDSGLCMLLLLLMDASYYWSSVRSFARRRKD